MEISVIRSAYVAGTSVSPKDSSDDWSRNQHETLGAPQGIANSPPAFSSGASTCGRSESGVSAPISGRKSSRSPLSRRGMNDSFGSVKA